MGIVTWDNVCPSVALIAKQGAVQEAALPPTLLRA